MSRVDAAASTVHASTAPVEQLGVLTPIASTSRFYVVVPCFQEERGLAATLSALAAQTDSDFTLVLVDNGSTDRSVQIAEHFARSAAPFPVEVLHEPEKGTGAASDTGFRFAIARGALWIARTDADCLPARTWVAQLKRALEYDGLDFVAGRIVPRRDEGLSLRERVVLPVMIALAERYGRLIRRGPQFKYPYFMAAGNNLAISAALYERAGGFPRTAIEVAHEDRELSERVRVLTGRAAMRRDIVVYNSVRRVRAYGFINVLRWYRNHGYRPSVVDVR
jgi:glycosyltransferase involved in cell wall biosynthesis